MDGGLTNREVAHHLFSVDSWCGSNLSPCRTGTTVEMNLGISPGSRAIQDRAREDLSREQGRPGEPQCGSVRDHCRRSSACPDRVNLSRCPRSTDSRSAEGSQSRCPRGNDSHFTVCAPPAASALSSAARLGAAHRSPNRCRRRHSPSPIVTDGEQSKPSFATYPLAGLATLSPDGS